MRRPLKTGLDPFVVVVLVTGFLGIGRLLIYAAAWVGWTLVVVHLAAVLLFGWILGRDAEP